MNAVHRLQCRQSAMLAWLLHGDAGIAGAIDTTRLNAGSGHDRLRIYADAYRLRLADVLGQDYPATKAMLGDARFDALADAYLRAHPSTRPSVRHFGHAFADWLASHCSWVLQTRRPIELPVILVALQIFFGFSGFAGWAVVAPSAGGVSAAAAASASDRMRVIMGK